MPRPVTGSRPPVPIRGAAAAPTKTRRVGRAAAVAAAAVFVLAATCRVALAPGDGQVEDDEQQVRTLGSGLAGAVAGMAAAGAVVLSGGAVLPAVAAAVAAGGGAVAGVRALGQAFAPGGQGEMGRAADAEGVTLAVRVDRPGEVGRAEEIIRGAGAARVWSRKRPYY
jgi:hypothetical protein